MEILKKGGEKRKQNNKQIGKQKQEKIEEKPKKSGTHPSRIRKVGKPTFEPLSSGRGDKRETRFPRWAMQGRFSSIEKVKSI